MRLTPVPPGTSPTLNDGDARMPEDQVPPKPDGKKELARLTDLIDARQRALHAEGRRAL